MAFAAVKEKLSNAARQNLQANFELQYDYPGEFVVFLDDWEGKGRNRRLNRRLLGHSPDMKPMGELVDSLPQEEQVRVQFVYAYDPFIEDEVWVL